MLEHLIYVYETYNIKYYVLESIIAKIENEMNNDNYIDNINDEYIKNAVNDEIDDFITYIDTYLEHLKYNKINSKKNLDFYKENNRMPTLKERDSI